MTSTFTHHKRGSMTMQRRARIFEQCGGKCEACGRKLGPADHWDADHRIALENGGTDDDNNMPPAGLRHAPVRAGSAAMARTASAPTRARCTP